MIPLFKVYMHPDVMGPLEETLFSGYVGQGPRVEEFEEALAAWVGGSRPLTVNSGTAAIRLALRLAGVGPGDSVVTSPMTCTATNMPILEQFARPVWADIDPWTGNIDPDSVARKIRKDTKAVIAVHWGGYPCELEALRKVCETRGVALIEDAAHAFGAVYKGAPIGKGSHFVAFSFQAIKHVTTVDGGALAVANAEAYRRGKLLRWYGIDRDVPRTDLRCEIDVQEAGYKAHLSDVAAAIGLVNLKHAPKILETHRENAAFYRRTLEDLKHVRLLSYCTDRLSSYWLFTVRVTDRDDFRKFMDGRGIMTSQVHVRNDFHTCFREYRADLPGVDEFSREQVSIPVGWWVSPEDTAWIARSARAWSEGVNR